MKRIASFALSALALTQGTVAFAVLHGKVVDFANYPHTVIVRTGSDTATGVLVGPRVVLTTRYGFGPKASVYVDGRIYAVTKSETQVHAGSNHFGVAALLLAEPVEGARPISVAEEVPAVGQEVVLFGYGPWSPETSAAPTLFLSLGTTRISKWEKQNGFTMVGSSVANFGDAGGPVTNGAGLLYGIMTMSNLVDQTLATNIGAHRNFLFGFAQANNVAVCGITELCVEP